MILTPELVHGGTLRLDASAVIVSVLVRLNEPSEYVSAFKAEQHAKKDDSNLSVALCVKVTPEARVVSARGFVGGVSAQPTELPLVALDGATLDESSLLSAAVAGEAAVLRAVGDAMAELTAAGDAHRGGRVGYRRVLCCVFVLRFLLRTARAVGEGSDAAVTSAIKSLRTDVAIVGSQTYPQNDASSRPAPVGTSVKHMAAEANVAGTATFIADIGAPHGCLHARLVTSTRAHAEITGLDTTAAQEVPGFLRLLDGGTIGASNTATLDGYGDLLAFDGTRGEVFFYGQAIAIVVAETESSAQAAAEATVVQYSDLPAVVTVADAVAQGGLYDLSSLGSNFGRIDFGNTEEALESAEVLVEGEVNIGSQEHFYLEPWGCVVTPHGDDEGVSAQCPTQGTTFMQMAVAAALGCGLSAVQIQSRRLGGGFGGKDDQQCNILAATAVAARLLRRPVRTMLTRTEDMLQKGGRHAFLGKYKLGATAEGKILGMEVDLIANGGAWLTSSIGILCCAILKGFTTYDLPNLKVVGAIARTNYCPSSVFRGAGQPQAAFIVEAAVDALCQRIAVGSVQRSLAIRQSNLVVDGKLSYINQMYEEVPVKRAYEELLAECDVEVRCAAMEAFNAEHRWQKRGLAVVPTVRFVSLGKEDNQGLALVNMYTDGTIVVHTGGIEMGQGLHTKIAQVVAAELGVEMKTIRVAEVTTDVLPNTSATAGSTGTDFNAAAAINACRTLMAGLAGVREHLGPDATMAQVAKEARSRRIPLQATGYHRADLGGFDFETGRGVWDQELPVAGCGDGKAPAVGATAETDASTQGAAARGLGLERVGPVGADVAEHFACGVACVEVLLDVMTGEHVITRADVVVDAGQSLNPALDVGQAEGAFMMGVGYHTLEEIEVGAPGSHRWLPVGVVHSTTPDIYRVPTMANTPREFNTRLLGSSVNSRRKAVTPRRAWARSPRFWARRHSSLCATRCMRQGKTLGARLTSSLGRQRRYDHALPNQLPHDYHTVG